MACISMEIRTLTLRLPEKEFKKLKNMAEEHKILGLCTSWESFILGLAEIKTERKEVRARK